MRFSITVFFLLKMTIFHNIFCLGQPKMLPLPTIHSRKSFKNAILTSFPSVTMVTGHIATNNWCLGFLRIKIYETVSYEENRCLATLIFILIWRVLVIYCNHNTVIKSFLKYLIFYFNNVYMYFMFTIYDNTH